MKIMFLTAGLGTRLRPATLIKPKPALELLNIPLLAYGAHLTACLGPSVVVANTHYLPEQVEQLVRGLWPDPASVRISAEQPEILGSGGGVSRAQVHLAGENFLYANGDEVFLPVQHDILKRVQRVHELSGALATLIVIPHPLVGTKFGGVWADPLSGAVAGFGKTNPAAELSTPGPGASLSGWHFTGYMFLSPRIFLYLSHDRNFNILYDGLSRAIADGESVQSFHVNGEWYEVGHTADFFTVTELLLRQLIAQMESEFTGGSEFVGTEELSVQYLVELARHSGAGYLVWERAGETQCRPLIPHEARGTGPTGWNLAGLTLAPGAVALISADAQILGPLKIQGFAVIGARVHVPASASVVENSIVMSGARWPERASLKNEMIVR